MLSLERLLCKETPLEHTLQEYANVAGCFQRPQMDLFLGAQTPHNKLSLAGDKGSPTPRKKMHQQSKNHREMLRYTTGEMQDEPTASVLTHK